MEVVEGADGSERLVDGATILNGACGICVWLELVLCDVELVLCCALMVAFGKAYPCTAIAPT